MNISISLFIQSYFGCLLRTSNVGGANEVGIGDFPLQPNVTSTSIGESNSIRIVLGFIFVRFSNWLVNENKPLYNFLVNKWYFDKLYNYLFVRTSKRIGTFLWKNIDVKTIDRFGPDGISNLIKKLSNKAVKFQSGYIYQYAFIMLLGFTALLTYLIII